MSNTRERIKRSQGDFYTDCEDCLLCDCPPRVAPSLVKMHIDPNGYHKESTCYFYRQPETPEEVDLAVEALASSCVQALRYRGNDPTILKKLAELDMLDFCDSV